MSYHIYQTEGFVLGGINVGEDSRLVRFFTRDLGVIYAKAQGVRKVTSKNRQHVQDFSLGAYAFVRGKAGWRLTGAEKKKVSFSSEDFTSIAKLSSLISRLSPGERKDERFFEEFQHALLFLSKEKLDEGERKSFETFLAMKILSFLGYWGDGEDELFYKKDLSRELLQEIFGSRRKMNVRIHQALEYTHL